MSATVRTLIADYDAGNDTRGGTLGRLSDLVVDLGVPAVIEALPDEWRRAFVESVREQFDNDVPIDEFFTIGGGPADLERLRAMIRLLREWLRATP